MCRPAVAPRRRSRGSELGRSDPSRAGRSVPPAQQSSTKELGFEAWPVPNRASRQRKTLILGRPTLVTAYERSISGRVRASDRPRLGLAGRHRRARLFGRGWSVSGHAVSLRSSGRCRWCGNRREPPSQLQSACPECQCAGITSVALQARTVPAPSLPPKAARYQPILPSRRPHAIAASCPRAHRPQSGGR